MQASIILPATVVPDMFTVQGCSLPDGNETIIADEVMTRRANSPAWDGTTVNMIKVPVPIVLTLHGEPRSKDMTKLISVRGGICQAPFSSTA
jgi:hypothetical protein